MRIFAKPKHRGVEQLVARRAHNPEAGGSSPSPATKIDNWLFYSRLFLFFLSNMWYNCPNPVTVDVGIISILRLRYSRDIHLAGRPAPEGIVGHIARPGGIKNRSPGRQKIKKLPQRYL